MNKSFANQDMGRRISTRLAGHPVLDWLSIVFAVFMGWIAWDLATETEGILVFVGYLLLTIWYFYFGCRVRRIWLNGTDLHVGNYLRGGFTRVPIRQIKSVQLKGGINKRYVLITFREKSKAGSKIALFPKVRQWGTLQDHPDVVELFNLVAQEWSDGNYERTINRIGPMNRST